MDINGAYSSLLQEVKTSEYYTCIDLTNRVNVYTCSNGHLTKTKDVDAGITPAMIACPQCEEFAHSSFYRDIAPYLEPTMEWYRPTLEDFQEMRLRRDWDIDHLLKGGLILRSVETKQDVFKITRVNHDYYFEQRTKPHDNSVVTQDPKHRNGKRNQVNRNKNKASRKARKQNRR